MVGYVGTVVWIMDSPSRAWGGSWAGVLNLGACLPLRALSPKLDFGKVPKLKNI